MWVDLAKISKTICIANNNAQKFSDFNSHCRKNRPKIPFYIGIEY